MMSNMSQLGLGVEVHNLDCQELDKGPVVSMYRKEQLEWFNRLAGSSCYSIHLG